jgi:hypothetical protein
MLTNCRDTSRKVVPWQMTARSRLLGDRFVLAEEVRAPRRACSWRHDSALDRRVARRAPRRACSVEAMIETVGLNHSLHRASSVGATDDGLLASCAESLVPPSKLGGDPARRSKRDGCTGSEAQARGGLDNASTCAFGYGLTSRPKRIGKRRYELAAASASAAWRRSFARARLRAGPMLFTGTPIWLLIS